MPREHNFVEHKDCHLENGCMICDGGLALCENCRCLEGSLATECPGFDVGDEVATLIHQGFADFKDGNWVFNPKRLKSITEGDNDNA